ncbi:MAG: molybdopterin molybdotransferase MoeA [Acidimicrobiales bacterium]
MIPLAEARAHVLDRVAPLPPQRWPLPDVVGCVVAEDVRSEEAIPPFANTAVDGFAVRAADTIGADGQRPAALAVVGTVAAGDAAERPVGPGEAVRIMTGGPIPPGADAVVMVEDTEMDGERVLVRVEVAPAQSVRPAGDDLRPGDLVVAKGTVLSVGHLGLLYSLGRTDVAVHPRPRVGVLSTGSELVVGSTPLGPGQIRDSNRPTLLALVAEAGAVPVDLGLVVDDERLIAAALGRWVRDCDAICTSGGVSMGEFDYVKAVLDRIGDMRWMQVAIKPAKPFAFGVVAAGDRSVPVFGLPGNPVSSMVSFEVLARPALRRMLGHADDDLDRLTVRATIDEPLRRHVDGKTHFARVVVTYGDDARFHIRSAGGQGSHQLTGIAGAGGLAVLDPDARSEAGDEVPVILIGEVARGGWGTSGGDHVT